MFVELHNINTRPKPFEFYTASELWTNEYTSKQMLNYHLNADVDVSSRNAKFIYDSVEWIAARFNIKSGTNIADFGCGPGLYTQKLAKKNAKVTGIDFSERSILYASERAAKEGLTIRYVNQDYLEFETNDRFNLILMIMCDFCALSPAQRESMLDKFHAILKPGGRVLFDVYSLNAFDQRAESAVYEANLLNGFWSPNKYYGFLNTFVYDKEKIVLDKYTIIESDYMKTVYNWLQYFSPESLERELASCGFKVEDIYSNVAGKAFYPNTTEFAVVARKG